MGLLFMDVINQLGLYYKKSVVFFKTIFTRGCNYIIPEANLVITLRWRNSPHIVAVTN